MSEINFRYKKAVQTIFLFIIFLLTTFYFEDYFFNTKVTLPKSLSFGWRDAINAIKPIESQYTNIFIEQGTQSQSFIAFYETIDPNHFRAASEIWDKNIKEKKVKYLDQMDRYYLNKYVFGYFSWPEDKNKTTLYIWQGKGMLPLDRRTIRQITSPTGEIIMEVFDFR